MSKGLGRVQGAILALIAAEPDGAWSFEELCRLIYLEPGPVTRAQLGAVGRALKHMTLPGTWTTGGGWGDRRSWLYDECSLASVRKTRSYWNESNFEPAGPVFKEVEEAKRWRDGSPLERIEIRIKHAESYMGALGMALKAGGRNVALLTARLNKAVEQIKELDNEKTELLAQGQR